MGQRGKRKKNKTKKVKKKINKIPNLSSRFISKKSVSEELSIVNYQIRYIFLSRKETNKNFYTFYENISLSCKLQNIETFSNFRFTPMDIRNKKEISMNCSEIQLIDTLIDNKKIIDLIFSRENIEINYEKFYRGNICYDLPESIIFYVDKGYDRVSKIKNLYN